MEDKNQFITSLQNECLKQISQKKISMPNLAFKMGISLIELYKILLNPYDDISYYLNILYLIN